MTEPSPKNSNQQPLSGPDRPTSTFSTSPMADVASEDGDAPTRTGTAGSARPTSKPAGVTGPVGEAGLPPSRPSSAATGHSSRGGWSHAAPSRRGVPPSVAGSTGAASTRPPTSHSRTHVPSLTAQAFFRPMSSQRLQAQRGQRPLSLLGQSSVSGEDGKSDTASNANRASHGSGQNMQGPLNAPAVQQDENARPVSRGTDITDLPEHGTGNNSPERAETVRSQGESETPLHSDPASRQVPVRLDLNKSPSVQPPPKSPRSFRSSFILPARNSRSGNGNSKTSVTPRQQGHEKLGSTESTPKMTAQDNPKVQTARRLGNNYEYFTGNTVFCWGGRMQNTKDKPISLFTAIAAIIPGPLFIAQSGVWFWLHVSPAITIVYSYLWLLTLSSFLHASVTNPGILPRNLHPFPPPNPNEDPLTIGPPTTDWTMVISATSSTAAMEVPTKYCKTCNIWRPPRAHHCRVCDNCVETQDHHCVWLNNCVGRRNYRYFFAFVSFGSTLGLFLIAASMANLALYSTRNHVPFGHAIKKFPLALAMFIYGLIATPYPIALWGYHVYLMARGETTREFLQSHKFRPQDRHRPFTQGNFFKNWIVVLIRPRAPTYLHFKRKYIEGDQRFGERKGKRTTALAPEQQGGGLEMQNIGGMLPSFQGPTSRAPRTGGE